MKEQPGKDIWLVGGGQINTVMLKAGGLIDEVILTVFPLVLGEGIQVFSVKDLHIYRLFSLPCPGAKQLRRPIQQLGLPLRDLVRVHIELACQLRKCPVAAHCKSHLRELCRVVTAGSSAHLSLLSPRALSCPQSAAIPLIPLFRFPEPLLSTYQLTLTVDEFPYPGKANYVFTKGEPPQNTDYVEFVSREIAFVGSLKEQPGKDI